MSNATRTFCTGIILVMFLGGLFLLVAGDLRNNIQRQIYGLAMILGALCARSGWSMSEAAERDKRIKQLEEQARRNQDGQPSNPADSQTRR